MEDMEKRKIKEKPNKKRVELIKKARDTDKTMLEILKDLGKVKE